MRGIILVCSILLLFCGCGGQEVDSCSPGGRYAHCVYTLEHNGCAAIPIKSGWEGDLYLDTPQGIFCSEFGWTEGPYWAFDVPGASACEVNVAASAFPVDGNRVRGHGTVDVACDTFDRCSYLVEIECER
jgi:hypothetical protein